MRTHLFGLRSAFWPLFYAIVCTTLLFAQSDVGTITGFVRDQSGAIVANAQVTITNEQHTVVTDTSGHYTVPNLPPGSYQMSASASGFKKFESRDNRLNASSTISLDGISP